MSIRNIKLNLLPQEYRPAPTVTVFPFIFGLTVGVAILFMLITLILTQAKIENAKGRIASTQAQIDHMKPQADEYDRLSADVSALEKQKAVFAYLDRGFVDWAEFIVNLAPLVPEGVWLYEIKSQTEIESENTAKVEILGRTADGKVLPISVFMNNLESTPYFTDASFTESTIQFVGDKAIQDFAITVFVKTPKRYDPPKKPETPPAEEKTTASKNVAAAKKGTT